MVGLAGGPWLLTELPWQPLVDVEGVLFRIQAAGFRVLLAHPDRYNHLDTEVVARLVDRGVRTQLEIGSFANLYGRRGHFRAIDLADNGLAHVLATDMHSPADAPAWISAGLRAVGRVGRRRRDAWLHYYP